MRHAFTRQSGNAPSTQLRRTPVALALALLLAAPLTAMAADPVCLNPDGTPNPGTNTDLGAENGGHDNSTCSTNASAFGTQNNVTGSRSNAFGNHNIVTGNNSSAFGTNNIVKGSGSNAIGYGNQATYSDSNAFGRNNETTSAFREGLNNPL